jgi:hypothetical protein
MQKLSSGEYVSAPNKQTIPDKISKFTPPTQFHQHLDTFSSLEATNPHENLFILWFSLSLSLCSNNRAAEHSRLSDEPFVSAADDNFSTNTSTPTSLKKQESIESPLKDVSYRKRNSKSLPLRSDGSLDYDGKKKMQICHSQFFVINFLSRTHTLFED